VASAFQAKMGDNVWRAYAERMKNAIRHARVLAERGDELRERSRRLSEHAESAATRVRALSPERPHDSARPDRLNCPFCGSTNISPAGTLFPHLDRELLIVCLACDAGFAVKTPRAEA